MLKCLEEQLLSAVVCNEKSILEEQLKQLRAVNFKERDLIKKHENSLLQVLTTCPGNVLENSEIINILNETKSKVLEVSSL